MIMLKKRLNEVVDIFEAPTNGIFYALHSIPNLGDSFKWLDNYEQLDLDYYLSHSGMKYISRFYSVMIEHNKTITDVAKIILNRFGDKWKRIYDAMMMEYNPINNYDMEETEDVNSKIVSKVNTGAKAYGFNSIEASPTDDTESESTTEGSKDDNVRHLRRSGNVGITTSAELLTQEIRVRQNVFIDMIMSDIDTMLCLQIY